MSSHRLLLGTYTSTVHLVEFTPPTTSQAPTLRLIKDLAIPRASWITRHPKLNEMWYIAHEADDDGGRAAGVEGFIWVYRITPDGQAEKLGEVAAVDNPCHVEVVAGGAGLAAACFSAGSAILISLNEDGTFKEANNNYIKLPASGPETETAKCHQCIDVPSRQECWIVDTGNACLQRMKITKNDEDTLGWKLSDRLEVLPGQGPRQAVLSPDVQHVYTLHARSCLVSHHRLSETSGRHLVSTHNILPHDPIDLNNRHPPYTIAAALNLHEPSSTLIATSRFVRDQPSDSVAFLKLGKDGSIIHGSVRSPARGKEFRGVGLVGDCFLVAGQHNGWISCFAWDHKREEWNEREFEVPVQFEKVVDIKAF